ncbi:MAG: 50S ribosomal protein L6 [Candidatus Pacearchaeota archaeon]
MEFPEGTNFDVSNSVISVSKGDKKMKKEFNLSNIHAKKEGRELILEAKNATKREKTMINTIEAHIKNMIKGLDEEYIYKLEVAYLHFPVTLDVNKEKGLISIKNFLGEKKPRTSKIVKGADVEVNKNTITVTSHDKEVAGQTAANIEKATKIRNRDRRKFQDGIFITEKCGRAI